MLGGPNPVTSALPHTRTSSSFRSKSIWLPAGRVTWSGKTTCLLGVLVSKLLPHVVYEGKMRHTELSYDMWRRVVCYKSTDVSGGSCFFSHQCSYVCPWRRQQDLLKRRYNCRLILGKRAPCACWIGGWVGSRAGRESFTKEIIFFPFPRTEPKTYCLVTIPAVVLCKTHSVDNMRSGSYSCHSALKGYIQKIQSPILSTQDPPADFSCHCVSFLQCDVNNGRMNGNYDTWNVSRNKWQFRHSES